MNLHIMNDEKVINRTIEMFDEALPNKNTYIILCPKEQCRYVKVEKDNVYYVEYGTQSFWRYVGDVKKYNYILIHYLSFVAADFVNKIEHHRIVWIIWGADLYNNLLQKKGFQLYAEPQKAIYYTIKENPIRALKDIIKRNIYYSRVKRSLHRISYATSPCDIAQLKKYFPECNVREKKFFYYPIDEIVGDLKLMEGTLGDNIILGNSASFSNNHVEILYKLSKLDLKRRKIVTPLSYGEGKQYVIKKGLELCPSNFSPIMDFMPLNNYNELLLGSSTFIYGNYRQEAVGNIVTALYLGGAVFLQKRNPLYKYFKDLEFILFSVDDLPDMIHYKLMQNEKENNRQLCCSYFGKKHLLETIKTEFS